MSLLDMDRRDKEEKRKKERKKERKNERKKYKKYRCVCVCGGGGGGGGRGASSLSIRPASDLFQRQTSRKKSERRDGAHMGFPQRPYIYITSNLDNNYSCLSVTL